MTSSDDQPWHAMPGEEAIRRLGARVEGLSDSEAAEQREKFGPNTPPESRREALVGVILRQFANPLIYILMVAALISAALQHWSDVAFIAVVIIVDGAIGAVLEWNAETSAAALRRTMRVLSTVVRAGRRREIDSSELVPGDIVLLQSGSAVPADVRLISSQDLRADESLLTGEANPVRKEAAAVLATGTVVADRPNMLHAGTMVVRGRGVGVVCATGAATQLGAIAGLLAGRGGEPPLLLRMRAFTNRLAVVTIALVLVLALGQVARGDPLFDILLFTIALAVSAIPEGLPIAITAALGVAATRMGRRGVIVRRLPAVEALGSCTLIATDKTGTLTANRLTVKRVVLADGAAFDVDGEGLELEGAIHPVDSALGAPVAELGVLAEAAALTNEADLHREDGAVEARGDAVDIAFLVFAVKLGIERAKLCAGSQHVSSLPYEPKHGYSASLDRRGDVPVISVKGAPEAVLPMCANAAGAQKIAHALAAQGYRVLAVAQGPRASEPAMRREDLSDLRLIGFAGLVDPLRDEAPAAVAAARAAGLDVRMITGDHPETALAIARQLEPSLAQRVITGAEMVALSGAARAEAIRDATVFARVEPTQKNLIVTELQEQGHFVAVTGDGVNDAPALRTAHVGVAMGADGTDVARAAADLIITDDNFASIVAGVEEGRAAYDNIRKVIWLLLSTGAAEVILFALAVAAGSPMPLRAVQILWLNLVHEGVQDIALGLEAKEPGVMRRPPRRPREPLFDRQMIEQCLLTGVFVGGLGFALSVWLRAVAGYDVAGAQNLVLLFMVSYSNLHALNCRSETRSILQIPLGANPTLIAGVVGAQALHITAMHIPLLQDVLGLRPVSLAEWCGVLGLAASVIVIGETYKLLRARPRALRGLTGVAGLSQRNVA